ncbi:hypothetical protein Sste5346_008785 [Sporothrix stenoceras]|uniref:Glycoside hydrolase family 31 N-terminal domain-containing protein n=1 Tax=Sporothrix stenoceras TaxID=5173 RepID=A0ABR3YMY6_9PEZI
MKIRDGMWHTAEGLYVKYAEEVYETTTTTRGVRLLCPTGKIRSRGDTLNQPTVTLTIEAEADGILSVEAVHWDGAQRRGPNFELFPHGRQEAEAVITNNATSTTVASGSLAATVTTNDEDGSRIFGVRFHPSADSDSRRTLTSMSHRSVGFAISPALSNPQQVETMNDKEHYIFTQTDLGVGESIHGLGERFGAFNKVGQQVELWNADGGTSSEQAYKNIPFFMSSRGYGVFLDTPDRVELEVGSARCSRVEALVHGQRLKWYLIYGPTPRDVLRRYGQLTGQPRTLPSWSYGLWLSTSFTTNYDESTVQGFLTGMRDRGIQVDVFHFDCFWMRAFTWTDFVFDSERFPDPAGQIARLKKAGLCRKVCVWMNPYIAQNGAAFAYAAEKGYLLRRPNGDIWQWDLWQAGMGLVDFTNPEACKWYAESLNKLFDLGVDAIKTDFGERIPIRDVQWHDQSVDPSRMHNYYTFLYNRVVYEALTARYGEGQGILFARSATAGGQRFPLHWGGDCESTAVAMAESVRGGLSLGLSGFSFWSVDIGGFEGSPPPWIYKRWVAFGLLCSHSRLHGSNSYRVPWTIDNDDRSPSSATTTLARWTALKNRLLPYLLAQAKESVNDSVPVSVRATCIEFPDDPTAWTLDRQFFIGDSLLAAPVFEEDGEVEFYLPRGRWTSFFTNKVRTGPGWFRERHGFGSMPLYVRENTVLILGGASSATGRSAVYDYASDTEVVTYGVQPGTKAVVVNADGDVSGTIEVNTDGNITGTEVLTGSWKHSRDERALGDLTVADEIVDLSA